MTDPASGGESYRRSILRLIKRDLPNRALASTWCGQHDKDRTRLILRRKYVCLDCVREASIAQ